MYKRQISTDSNVYANILIYDKNGSTIEENKQLISLYPNDTDNKGNNTSDWTKSVSYTHLDVYKRQVYYKV